MNKLIVLVSGLALLLQALPVMAAPPQPAKTKTFAQWCLKRNSVPAATKLTIDLLLKQAGTKNCQLANSKLNTLTELNLSEGRISDLKPISSLVELTSLTLYNNKISDLQPLSGLTKLIDLNLNLNKISNVKPLAGLSKLKTLYLQNNQISDIKPLSRLKLDSICLFNNKIIEKDGACKL
jgi:internalin A